MLADYPPILVAGIPSVLLHTCIELLRKQGFQVSTSECLPDPHQPQDPSEGHICVAIVRDPQTAVHEVGLYRERALDIPLVVVNDTGAPGLTVDLLDAGADDVLHPARAPAQLAARVRALHRRYGFANIAVQTPMLVAGDLKIDFRKHRVWVRNRELLLSPTEFRILRKLSLHIGRVVPHQEILAAVWGDRQPKGSDAIRVYIRHIRRKAQAAGEGINIVTRPGIGYMLAAPS